LNQQWRDAVENLRAAIKKSRHCGGFNSRANKLPPIHPGEILRE
jgi:hypothetical protein